MRSTSLVLTTILAVSSFACSGGTTVTGTGEPVDVGRPQPARTDGEHDDSSSPGPDPTSDDAGTDTEPPELLRIENFNVVEASNRYELTFVLSNGANVDVDRIQAATLSFDNMSASFALTCSMSSSSSYSSTPWPYAGQTTPIVTWKFWQPDYNQNAVLQDVCGTNDSSDSVPLRPWIGDMTLELRGLFEDGKAFKIRATATP